MAAGLRGLDPATQYMMLDFDMEIVVENDASILQGVAARLAIQDKARRVELHPEESEESWQARYRVHRTGAPIPIPHEEMAEVVVHVNMLERQAAPGIYHTSRFISTVAYAGIHDPYEAISEGATGDFRDPVRCEGYWIGLTQELDMIVQGYRAVVG